MARGRERVALVGSLMRAGYRFYDELAAWWPLISPADEYAEEAAFAASLLRGAVAPVREVLELGSGGGHNALYLKRDFSLTLVDLAQPMLEISRLANPECTHVCGDMRTLRLGREFDAVFIHDAIEYMTSEEELLAALTTASLHCRAGGLVVVIPDATAETFEPSTDCGGSDDADGRGVRYLEWTWDPDPDDDWVQTEYSFLLREADGTLRTVHESHRTGLFSEARWLALLSEVGLAPKRIVETTSEEREPRTVFVATKPSGS